MAQQTINIGSSPNKGDGDPLRTAFDKINDNFTELYARDLNTDAQTLSLNGNTLSITDGNSVTLNISPVGDLTGSVFADDSTILVDGVAGKIRGDIENGTVNITSTVADVNITAADDIDLETTGANGDIRLTSSDNIRLSSFSDTDISSNTEVRIFTDAGNSLHNFVFSETGYFEVLADNGGININNELNFNSGGSPTATMKLNSTILEVENTGGFRLKDSGGNTQLEYLNESTGVLNVAGTINGKLDGDVEGSVFADDSTLLVDGVNGVIPYGVLDGAPTALSDFSNDLDYAAIVATQIQTNGLPIDTPAINLVSKDGQTFYIQSKSGAVTSTNVAFVYDTNVSGNVKNIFYGTTEFGNNGEAPAVNFAGVTVTGLNAPYTPSTDAHWTDPNPTTVSEALDRLASAIYAANGGTPV